jgi:hypothetical protein|tara:strand:- start:35 stop:298 length:264 start_codon:yes stop_codon:yes gene_type:complete
MIPYIGIFIGFYYVVTSNIAAASVLALLGIVQSIICLGFVILQILYNGTRGTLEVTVELWDALIPTIFFMLSFTSFLYLTLDNLTGT